MNVIVFDTETISIDKCFCYDLGYTIYDTDSKQVVKKAGFVIEQIWSNKPLFETAYYSTKKQLYVSKMRGRKIKLVKWGYAVNEVIKDIKAYNITTAFAFNSDFDNRVIDMNAEWYHTRNFLDYVELYDIWGMTSQLILKGYAKDYEQFCIDNNFISDSGNYKNNADTWGKFLKQDLEWNEEHTALEDSIIETEILKHCLKKLELGIHYKKCKTIKANTTQVKTLTVKCNNQEFKFDYQTKTEYKKNGWLIHLK